MDDLPFYPARAYFDTTTLLSSGWPRFSAEFEILLADAGQLSMTCIVPEPVLAELEHHWLRDFRNDRTAAEKLAARLERIAGPPPSRPSTEAEALASYRAHVAKLMSGGLHESPFTARSAADVFGYSLRRELTFTGDKDVGFQDALILLSVLDHCDPELPAVLISDDAAFSNDSTTNYLRASGKQLRVLRTIKDLRRELDEHAKTHGALLTRLDRLRIANAIVKRFPELQSFATAKVALPAHLLTQLGFQVRSFNGLSLDSFNETAVQVNWVNKEDPQAPVNISLQIAATIKLSTQRQGILLPAPLRIGETQRPPTGEELYEALRWRVATEEWDAIVAVDARTTVADSEFEEIVFTDARILDARRRIAASPPET